MRVQSQFIEMFGDVEKKPFVDVCISKGEYGSNSPADDYDGNIRYVRITDITEEGNLNGVVVSPRKVEEKYMLLQDDLLFARTGNTVGKTYLHKNGKMIFAGYLIRYRLNKKLMLPQFAFAYTHTNQYYDWVEKIKKVGAQPNISAAQYDSMPIPVPSMAKQIEFVAITKQADKSKFVGFKSQFIEMFGNSIHTKKLIEVCNIEKGSTITKEQTSNGDIPVVAGGLEPSCYHNVANRPAGMITVSASGANAGYVNYWEVPIFASDCNTIYPIELEKVSPIFMYWQLKVIQKQIYKLQKGGAQPHVYGKDLADMQIVQPPMEFQLRYIKIAEQADKSKYYN